MADPRTFQFDIPAAGRPEWFPLPEPFYPDAEWYSVHRASDRIYSTITGIRAVVIHATAGWASSHALDHWRNVKASAHWVIPDEDEEAHGKHIWAVVRESRAAWHVGNPRSHPDVWNGATKINHWSVGIEIVNTQNVQNYTDPFSDWQIRMTALIIRRCWARYPNLAHVVSHAKLDPGRRADPGHQFPWEKLRDFSFDSSHDFGLAPETASVPRPTGESPVPQGGSCCM